MSDQKLIPRAMAQRLTRAAAERPVVCLTGSRQAGKSTLVQAALVDSGLVERFETFDDPRLLDAAISDPVGFIERLPRAVALDEVQRVPELFSAIKLSVDRDRVAGRFVLTGSANVLLLPKLSESLAGRMELIQLWPLSQAEIHRSSGCFTDHVFEKGFLARTVKTASGRQLGGLSEAIVHGGYPEVVVAKMDADGRSRWFASYLETLLVRDVRELANIDRLSQMPRLLNVLADRAATPVNLAGLSRDLGIPASSLNRYMALFESIFIVVRVPAWHRKTGRRMMKAPKLLFADSGLHAHLAGANTIDNKRFRGEFGRTLENFVGAELLKQCSFGERWVKLYHYRSVSQHEVDFVLEAPDGRVFGVEVKASASPSSGDLRGLKALAEDTGANFAGGVILHTGDVALSFGDQLAAVPVDVLWGGAR